MHSVYHMSVEQDVNTFFVARVHIFMIARVWLSTIFIVERVQPIHCDSIFCVLKEYFHQISRRLRNQNLTAITNNLLFCKFCYKYCYGSNNKYIKQFFLLISFITTATFSYMYVQMTNSHHVLLVIVLNFILLFTMVHHLKSYVLISSLLFCFTFYCYRFQF